MGCGRSAEEVGEPREVADTIVCWPRSGLRILRGRRFWWMAGFIKDCSVRLCRTAGAAVPMRGLS